MATASKQVDVHKTDKTELTEQLKCPICLEVYKTPRALSCLHTFCERCLNSYIVKSVEKGSPKSAIQCPMCRKDTAAPNPTKPPSEWARELPLNLAITPMLESMESESRQILCENCKESDWKSSAKFYCKECMAHQCENCMSIHSRFKTMKTHNIISLDKIPKEQIGRTHLVKLDYCHLHANKEVEFFCEDDQKLCCSTCAIVDHRSCKNVTEVKKLGKGVIEKGMPHLDSQMDSLQTQLEGITVTMENNVSDIEKQAVEIPRKMAEVRRKVVKVFDEMVTKVTSECGQIKKQQTTELSDKITSNRSLDAAISSSRSLIQALMKNVDETQAFVAFHRLKEQLHQYQKQVKDATRTSTISSIQLSLEKEVDTVIQPVKPLATVKLQAISLRHHIAECRIEKQPLIELGSVMFQGAVVCLPDGRRVATNRSNNWCILLDDTFQEINHVSFNSYPTDLAVIGPTEVMIVLPKLKTLQGVSVNGTQMTLTRSIPCTRVPYCISRVSDTEVAVGWDVGIGIINLDGKEKSYIDQDKNGSRISFDQHDRIAVDVTDRRCYRSDCNAQSVSCLDFNGKVNFTYSSGLQSPTGVAVDRDGNVYIVSHHTHNVHQLKSSGELISVITTDMGQPYMICFNHDGNEMMVVDYGSGKGQIVRFVPPN